jgi:SAM-dependent methyltransferase
MGLPTYIGEMLFAENAYKPIKGNVGFIGRQTTYLRPASLDYLSARYKHAPAPNLTPEYDERTKAGQRGRGSFITDRYLMKYLGAKSFKSIDVSDYEGADIVFDLCGKLPPKLKGSFDFIFDGSCLDNVFNPAAALSNISRLLKPGGRAMLLNHGTWLNAPYTIMSPGWYFDFFVVNGYVDCQIFLCLFRGNEGLHFGPVGLSFFNAASPIKVGNIPMNLPAGFDIMVVALAEKGRKSTDDVMPVQSLYRDKKYDEMVFTKKAARIFSSPRRLLGTPADLVADGRGFIPLPHLGMGIPLH